MSDDLTVISPDGIRRSYDEHYDTMMDVKQDPYGAWLAIQNQADRIEELEAKLAKALEARNEAIAATLAALQRHSKDEWVQNLRVPHVKRMIALMEDEDNE